MLKLTTSSAALYWASTAADSLVAYEGFEPNQVRVIVFAFLELRQCCSRDAKRVASERFDVFARVHSDQTHEEPLRTLARRFDLDQRGLLIFAADKEDLGELPEQSRVGVEDVHAYLATNAVRLGDDA